jgi:hypothetical protein
MAPLKGDGDGGGAVDEEVERFEEPTAEHALHEPGAACVGATRISVRHYLDIQRIPPPGKTRTMEYHLY